MFVYHVCLHKDITHIFAFSADVPLPGAEHKRKFRNKFAKARLGKNEYWGYDLEDNNEYIWTINEVY